MNSRRVMSTPETPAAAALFALLPPVFRWACSCEDGSRYGMHIPGEVAGRIVATDGIVAVWVGATPKLSAAVDAARAGIRKPFAPPTMRRYIQRADFAAEPIALSLDGLPACADCAGRGEVEWIECHCCGEKCHTPEVLFPCAACRGTGVDCNADVPCGPVALNPRYAVTLARLGATFRIAPSNPAAEPVRFVFPCGDVGLLMPLESRR